MRLHTSTALFLAGFLILTGCRSATGTAPTNTPASPSQDIEVATETLLTFFENLHTGNFEAGAAKYGGDFNVLTGWNPDVDASDPAALFEAACTRQLQCLPVRELILATQIDASIFNFIVEFSNPNGSLFILGPCCGATETEMPPVSQFDCSVEKFSEGDYRVMCLPVYVP
jgi:hypothetical protein